MTWKPGEPWALKCTRGRNVRDWSLPAAGGTPEDFVAQLRLGSTRATHFVVEWKTDGGGLIKLVSIDDGGDDKLYLEMMPLCEDARLVTSTSAAAVLAGNLFE